MAESRMFNIIIIKGFGLGISWVFGLQIIIACVVFSFYPYDEFGFKFSNQFLTNKGTRK